MYTLIDIEWIKFEKVAKVSFNCNAPDAGPPHPQALQAGRSRPHRLLKLVTERLGLSSHSSAAASAALGH
jgi:hypothetical protein